MCLSRRQRTRLFFVALFVLTSFEARANSPSESVVAAVNANDITALETLSRSGSTNYTRSLATGALLALHRKDARAMAELTPVTLSPASRVIRATAYLVLSDIYSRQEDYRDRYLAIRAASQLSRKSVNLGYQQSMALSKALIDVKPMRLVHDTPGSLPITGEDAGLIRIPIKVNGHKCGALVDTGASLSVISDSVAEQFGIHILNQPARVSSSTEGAVAVSLGIVNRLEIGEAIFENVVFIVVSDSNLRIPRSYRVSAIVGLPILMDLGPLELVNSKTPKLLYGDIRGVRSDQANTQPNLLLSGLELLVMVRVPHANNQLIMKLDTGSDRTYFTGEIAQQAPAILLHARQHVWHAAGAGGSVTERRALRIPDVTLIIHGQKIKLNHVIVSSRSSSTTSGVIGEDLFRLGRRWLIDFKTMTLAVTK